MQVQIKSWGNGQGIRFPKSFLKAAGIGMGDTLNAEICDGIIILRPGFRHRSLRERAEAFGGQLNLSTEEIDWGAPVEGEVW